MELRIKSKRPSRSPRDLGVDGPEEEVVAATPNGGGEVEGDAEATCGPVDDGGDDVEALYNLQHYDSEEGPHRCEPLYKG